VARQQVAPAPPGAQGREGLTFAVDRPPVVESRLPSGVALTPSFGHKSISIFGGE